MSRERPTAWIYVGRDGPVFSVNPDFAKEQIETDFDLAFIVFHEWLHVLRGHTNVQRMSLVFGHDLKTDADFFELPKRVQERITFAQELEVKHLEHLLMPEDHFHEINRRFYGERDDPQMKMLWRGTDPKELDDVYLEAVHERMFSRNRYSTREAYAIMNERAQEQGDEGDEGDEGSGEGGGAAEPDDRSPFLSSGSSVGPDASQDEVDQIADALSQVMDKAREEADRTEPDPEPDPTSRSDRADEQEDGLPPTGLGSDSGEKEMAPSPPVGGKPDLPPGTGTLIEETVKERVEVARQRQIAQAVKRVQTKPNYLARVSASLGRQTAKARSRSTVPNFSTDKRAQRDWLMGRYRAKYARRKAPSENLVALYFDISYSQDSFIPHCNEIVLQMKHLLVDQTLFVFSDYVVDVPVSEFVRRARAGTVQNIVKTRGTNFRAVVQHARKNGFSKLAVLTDNGDQIVPEDEMDPLTSRRDFYLLMIQTNTNPYWNDQGFAPYLSERIFVDAS